MCEHPAWELSARIMQRDAPASNPPQAGAANEFLTGQTNSLGSEGGVCTKHPFCAVAAGLLAAGSLVEFSVGCLQCLFSHV